MEIASVSFSKIKADPGYSDEESEPAYRWLEKEIGFYPLFLSVGTKQEDLQMTGYQNQWERTIGFKAPIQRADGTCIYKSILRERGTYPNRVLFSFGDVEGVFTDFDAWCRVLNAGYKKYNITDYEKKLIFKHSWPKSKWLRNAIKEPHSVQLVSAELDLREAERIWVRNKPTKEKLEDMGFGNVEVRKLPLAKRRLRAVLRRR